MKPEMKLIASTTATTYHFENVAHRRCGWSLCTVNDTTGELLITSDWGNWSHRWSPKHLGAPTLTHFIAARDSGHCDYLANKLTSAAEREWFCSYETVKAWRKLVGERYSDGGITRAEARELCKELDGLKGNDDERDFVEQFFLIENAEKILNEPWHELRHTETGTYRVLIESILPPLVVACAAREDVAAWLVQRAAEYAAYCKERAERAAGARP